MTALPRSLLIISLGSLVLVLHDWCCMTEAPLVQHGSGMFVYANIKLTLHACTIRNNYAAVPHQQGFSQNDIVAMFIFQRC